MRLLLVRPSTYDRRGDLVRGRKAFLPSRTLPYLAALTPPEFDVRIVDDLVQEVPVDTDADAVVMSGLLTNVPRAMDLAREFHRRGKPVIIGGMAVFSRGEQMAASGQFASVVHGEAEAVWPQVLDDLRRGELRPVYDGGRAADLAGLPVARYDLLDLRRYHKAPLSSKPFYTVETSRGCPYNCDFCGVSLFFGRQMRYRPVGDVVEEIRSLGARSLIITDDNVTANPDRAAELFRALAPLGVRWSGQFAMDALARPDVLKLAGQAGCRHAVVGVESLLEDNLRDVNKKQNLGASLDEAVGIFHDAGISFTASMILGLDHDTPETIDWTVARVLESGADFLLPWILTPGPGSAIFDDMKAQGRLLHENFSLYNGTEVVFTPRRMTPGQLQQSATRAMQTFYRLGPCLRRGLAASHRMETLALNLYFRHSVRKGMHPFTGVF